MHLDPNLVWDAPFPYDVLADAGIMPESSMDEIRNSLFDFMRDKRQREAIDAIDQLSQVESRLLIDFFFYRLDTSADAGEADGE